MWKRHAGATVNELRRIKELEAKNANLKGLYADLALENTAIKDVLTQSCRAVHEAPDGVFEVSPDTRGSRLAYPVQRGCPADACAPRCAARR